MVHGVCSTSFSTLRISPLLPSDYAIVPLYFFKNRTLTGAMIEIFFIFFAFLLAAIYLAFLYQAKGRTAVQSGVDIIPFSIATVVGTGLSGGIIRATGHYKPFLIFAPWFGSIAGGLLYTVDVNTSSAKLIGYQIILGMHFPLSPHSFLNDLQALDVAHPSRTHVSNTVPFSIEFS